MQFLYSGGCNSLDVVAPGDVLELMAAASFFQLHGLLRYTEARCSQMIDIDNVVAMYIHAKVSPLHLQLRIDSRSQLIPSSRSTMHPNWWNTVKGSSCRTWSLCWPTTIRSSDCYSQRKFQITMSSTGCWQRCRLASRIVELFRIQPMSSGSLTIPSAKYSNELLIKPAHQTLATYTLNHPKN